MKKGWEVKTIRLLMAFVLIFSVSILLTACGGGGGGSSDGDGGNSGGSGGGGVNMTRMVSYFSAGADGVWFTGDDAVSSYGSYTYDANGMVTRVVSYFSAGADGVWFTGDDVVGVYWSYTY